jgi:hypothetical protein
MRLAAGQTSRQVGLFDWLDKNFTKNFTDAKCMWVAHGGLTVPPADDGNDQRDC